MMGIFTWILDSLSIDQVRKLDFIVSTTLESRLRETQI
jgi:hypothetical protein